MNKEIKRIVTLLSLFCLAFLILAGFLTFFQIFSAKKVKKNNYNKRLWINEDAVLRGKFLDRNGNVLAHSERTENGQKRVYEHGNLYSHIIGYSYRQYGKTGLEMALNNSLLNISPNMAINDIKNLVLKNDIGNDVKLTINHSSQDKARKLLNGRKGSVIAMNPKTGEVYAMVSLPDFNVSNLDAEWRNITESKESPLLNRGLQGLYQPGSVFKIITASKGSETGIDNTFQCTGTLKVDGYEFKDYSKKGHGKLTRKEALAKSCNTYFINESNNFTKEEFLDIAERFMINKDIPFELSIAKSLYPIDNISKTEYAASLIGQGKTLMTPMNMLLVTSSIANDGVMMKPYLVDEIVNKNGTVVEKSKQRELARPVSSGTANDVKVMMRAVVESGTGTGASIKNVKVAGKTGTAENPSGKAHSWFTGFAPYDDPKVAVVVMLEEDGQTGGKTAAPVARDLMIEILNSLE